MQMHLKTLATEDDLNTAVCVLPVQNTWFKLLASLSSFQVESDVLDKSV